MSPRRVAVIGAGLAGLACAVAAAEAGCAVTVFEAAPQLADPPAAIEVVPNLLRDLVALGVADACLRDGFAFATAWALDERGQTRSEWRLPRRAGAACPPALGLRYGALLRRLHEAALGRGATLHFGQRVLTLQATETGAEQLGLTDGSSAVFDLVLLAAGVDSALRHARFPNAPAADSLGQHWWHTLVPRPAALDGVTWVIGPGRHKLVLVPVSIAWAGLAALRPGTDLALARTEAQRAAQLRAVLAASAPLVQQVAEVMTPCTPVAVRPVRSALLPGPWHHGAVLCVGEAAHTLPPHAGQPAAQGVEDALVLRELLRSTDTLAALLQQFSARRLPRATRVHAIALQAARWDLQPEARTDLPALARELDELVSQPA